MEVVASPAPLRALRNATEKHPVERKLLVCRTVGEGRELLRSLAAAGESWAAWEVTTTKRLALDLVAPPLADSGLTLADDFDQEAGVDAALQLALETPAHASLRALSETPGFRAAVAGAIRELRLAGVGPERLRATPASNTALRALLADVLDAYVAWLAGVALVDVADVLRRGAAVLRRQGGAALRGARVYLLSGLPARGAGGELVAALRDAGAEVLEADPVAVEVPTGVVWRDAPEPAPLSRLLAEEAPAEAAGGPEAEAAAELELFAASGPSDEVREVLRRVVAAGLRWDEVEIVATDPVVYGGALHALAQRLGIPVSFAVGLPVERTRTGRATAGYLRWIQAGFPSAEIRRLLESGDIRPPDWNGSHMKLARRLRGLRIGWGRDRYLRAIDRALDALDEPVRRRRKESTDDAAERIARERAELTALRSLLAPVLETIPRFDPADPTARVSPGDLAAGLKRFLELVAAGDRPSATAKDRLLSVADRIAARLTRPVAPAAALATLERHLRIRVPAPDREGSAPWVSSGGYLHLSDVDHGGLTGRRATFVVGLDAERFPGAGLQDPLLLDAQRRALDGDALPTSADRMDATRFALAAALARMRGRVTLSFSAWDPVEARAIAPSSVMLQAFRMARGRPAATFEDLADALGDAASPVPRTAAIDEADLWFDALDRDGILLDGTAAVRDAFPSLAAGSDALAALAGEDATAHHGLVRPRPELDPRDNEDVILSASGLEDLGTCGLRYFYKYALRVRPHDDPELDPDRWLDPLHRGSLLHSVYERTLREARERGIEAGDPAFEAHALAVLDEEAGRFRHILPPPGEAVMARELVALREDVRSFVDMVEGLDDRWEALELKFGLGDRPAAVVPLRGGRVRIRGAIDRVDREPDGGMVVVDYKTGGTGRHERSKKGLFHGGRRLQNVVYTAVAEATMEGRVERMEYHFPTRGGQNEVIGYTRDETRRGLGLLDRLLGMAAAGRFLPTPDGDDCKFCDYQPVCRHRFEGWSGETPLADWAKSRFGALDAYDDLRIIRDWEQLLLSGMDDDG